MNRFDAVKREADQNIETSQQRQVEIQSERARRDAELARQAILAADNRRGGPDAKRYQVHPTELASALRAWRREKGLSAYGAAARLGVSVAQYQNHEAKGLKTLSPEYHKRLVAEGVQLPPCK